MTDKARHTEGPWHIHESYVYGKSMQHDLIATAHDCCDTNQTAAEHAGAIGFEQCKANARLIAAAPELLEALKAARNVCERLYVARLGGYDIQDAAINAVTIADAAIAQTTGKGQELAEAKKRLDELDHAWDEAEREVERLEAEEAVREELGA